MSGIVKICKKHGDLTLSDVKVGKYKNKQYKKCRKCETERSKEYYKKIYADAEKHAHLKNSHKKYWAEKKEIIKNRRVANNDAETRRETYKKYATKYREKCNLKQKEYRETLSDNYLRRIIQNGDKNIPLMSIPDSMLRLKKSLLLAKREIFKQDESKIKRKLSR